MPNTHVRVFACALQVCRHVVVFDMCVTMGLDWIFELLDAFIGNRKTHKIKSETKKSKTSHTHTHTTQHQHHHHRIECANHCTAQYGVDLCVCACFALVKSCSQWFRVSSLSTLSSSSRSSHRPLIPMGVIWLIGTQTHIHGMHAYIKYLDVRVCVCETESESDSQSFVGRKLLNAKGSTSIRHALHMTDLSKFRMLNKPAQMAKIGRKKNTFWTFTKNIVSHIALFAWQWWKELQGRNPAAEQLTQNKQTKWNAFSHCNCWPVSLSLSRCVIYAAVVISCHFDDRDSECPIVIRWLSDDSQNSI